MKFDFSMLHLISGTEQGKHFIISVSAEMHFFVDGDRLVYSQNIIAEVTKFVVNKDKKKMCV